MIVGPFYKAIREKESLWGYLLFLVLIPIIVLTWPYGFVLLFAFFIFKDIVTTSKKKTFYELQGILPTSKVRSMAMGLVEITGKTIMIEPVASKVKKVPCIGYLYKIDSISRDKDGRKTYTNISKETVCNPFLVDDGTGTVTVQGENIELIDFPESKYSYESNGKRYQVFLLLENLSVLLIGRATKKNQKISIEKDNTKNIFAVSLLDKVQSWNFYKPLRNSLLRHMVVLLALITFIILCDFDVTDGRLVVSIPSFYEAVDFESIFNFR